MFYLKLIKFPFIIQAYKFQLIHKLLIKMHFMVGISEIKVGSYY